MKRTNGKIYENFIKKKSKIIIYLVQSMRAIGMSMLKLVLFPFWLLIPPIEEESIAIVSKFEVLFLSLSISRINGSIVSSPTAFVFGDIICIIKRVISLSSVSSASIISNGNNPWIPWLVSASQLRCIMEVVMNKVVISIPVEFVSS